MALPTVPPEAMLSSAAHEPAPSGDVVRAVELWLASIFLPINKYRKSKSPTSDVEPKLDTNVMGSMEFGLRAAQLRRTLTEMNRDATALAQ